MTWLLSLIMGAGVPARLAKPVLGIIVALALIGAFFGLKSCYDHGIINAHEAKQEAAAAEADRKADTKAAEQRRADDARLTTETQEIKEAVNEAGSDPAARRAAYYECVRKQQSARRNGKPPADC